MRSDILLITAFMLLAVSCETTDQETGDPNFIRVQVRQEAFLNEDGNEIALEWFEADSIRLFDTDGQGVTVRTNNFTEKNAPEVFFSPDWTAGSPLYMVRPASDAVVCTGGGVEGVVVNVEQEVMSPESLGTVPSMGNVTGNSTAYRASMKNLTGAIAFAMTDSTVASVTITSIGGEPVAGSVDIDYSKLESDAADFWHISEGVQGSSTVTVVPMEGSSAISANDTFHAGMFYAHILPQTYSQGIKVTATFLDGKQSEQIISGDEGGLVVPRSGIVAVNKAMDETLPDKFDVKIDFTGAWPFKESVLAASGQSQSGNGDKYTYEFSYTKDGFDYTLDLPLHIYGNKQTYTHTSGSLRLMARNSRLLLPAIYGRYIKSIKLEVVNTGAKAFDIVKTDWNTLVEGPKDITVNKPGVLTFPVGDVVTDKNAAYFLRFPVGSTFISSVTITYSMTLD